MYYKISWCKGQANKVDPKLVLFCFCFFCFLHGAFTLAIKNKYQFSIVNKEQ